MKGFDEFSSKNQCVDTKYTKEGLGVAFQKAPPSIPKRIESHIDQNNIPLSLLGKRGMGEGDQNDSDGNLKKHLKTELTPPTSSQQVTPYKQTLSFISSKSTLQVTENLQRQMQVGPPLSRTVQFPYQSSSTPTIDGTMLIYFDEHDCVVQCSEYTTKYFIQCGSEIIDFIITKKYMLDADNKGVTRHILTLPSKALIVLIEEGRILYTDGGGTVLPETVNKELSNTLSDIEKVNKKPLEVTVYEDGSVQCSTVYLPKNGLVIYPGGIKVNPQTAEVEYIKVNDEGVEQVVKIEKPTGNLRIDETGPFCYLYKSGKTIDKRVLKKRLKDRFPLLLNPESVRDEPHSVFMHSGAKIDLGKRLESLAALILKPFGYEGSEEAEKEALKKWPLGFKIADKLQLLNGCVQSQTVEVFLKKYVGIAYVYPVKKGFPPQIKTFLERIGITPTLYFKEQLLFSKCKDLIALLGVWTHEETSTVEKELRRDIFKDKLFEKILPLDEEYRSAAVFEFFSQYEYASASDKIYALEQLDKTINGTINNMLQGTWHKNVINKKPAMARILNISDTTMIKNTGPLNTRHQTSRLPSARNQNQRTQEPMPTITRSFTLYAKAPASEKKEQPASILPSKNTAI